MNKSVAIIETAKNCANCPLYSFEGHICRVNSKTILNVGAIAEWCPLVKLPTNEPECRYFDECELAYKEGWNYCLKEIENVNG